MFVLTAPALDLIHDIKPKTILCTSRPALIVPLEGIRTIYPCTKRGKGFEGLDVAFDIPDTDELFTLMGAKIRYISEDLNEPQDLGKYDLVIDGGSSKFFNVATALMNLAGALKDGGRILNVSPASVINQGFWNFNPTMFHDFYQANGFRVHGLWWLKGDESELAHPHGKGKLQPNLSLMCLAERVGNLPVNRYPTQSKPVEYGPRKPAAMGFTSMNFTPWDVQVKRGDN